jgi:hypothetical protein
MSDDLITEMAKALRLLPPGELVHKEVGGWCTTNITYRAAEILFHGVDVGALDEAAFADLRQVIMNSPHFRADFVRDLPAMRKAVQWAVSKGYPANSAVGLANAIESIAAKALQISHLGPPLIPHKAAVGYFQLRNATAKEESKFMERLRQKWGERLRCKKRKGMWYYDPSDVECIAKRSPEKVKNPPPEEIRSRTLAIRANHIIPHR